MNSMNIKKGDTVRVLSGKDKGKEGQVVRSLPSKQRVVVEKENMVKKAMRPTRGSHPCLQRHGHLPRVQAAHPRVPPRERGRQEGPRLQEVRQGHR